MVKHKEPIMDRVKLIFEPILRASLKVNELSAASGS
jgi:hypothetical protein